MIYSIVGVVQEAQGYLNEKLPPECFKELSLLLLDLAVDYLIHCSLYYTLHTY